MNRSHKPSAISFACGDDVAVLRERLGNVFRGHRIVERSRFKIADHLFDLVLDGRKHTTVRYEPGGVEVPARCVMPLVSVGGDDEGETPPAIDVRVSEVRYVRKCDLKPSDAKADGFRSLKDLLEALQGFYGDIAPDDILCIYSILPETCGLYPRQRSEAASALA